MNLNIDLNRIAELEKTHAKLWSSAPPKERLVTFGCSKIPEAINWQQMWDDPQKLFQFCMQRLEHILSTGDDTIPMVRVDLGTVLFPMAFGCDVHIEKNGMPAISSHPITTPEALEKVRNLDPLISGQFKKAYEFIKYFRKNLPAGIRLSQCDSQGPWNIAHQLAGDQIFFDIFDNPAFVTGLLDTVSDFIISAIPPMKEAVDENPDKFYLQGTCTPGGGRICNCSTDMISPDFYEKVILERDNRVLEAIGGGMLHNCASNIKSLAHANKIKSLKCVEIAFNYADLFEIADIIRDDIVLIACGPVDPPLLTPLGEKTLNRFANGVFPDKTNILYHLDDPIDDDRTKWLLDIIKG